MNSFDSQMENPSSPSPSQWALPPTFGTIEQVEAMTKESISSKPFVNIIGFVKDFRPAVKTRGTDWKCTLRLVDLSNQFSIGIELIIFKPGEDQMPRIHGHSDVVLLRKVKVQMYNSFVSLISNHVTEIHIIPHSKISKSLPINSEAIWESYPPMCKPPGVAETEYVIWANSQIEPSALPDSQEFHNKSIQALNVKDKFSLLKDIKPDNFYNVIGEVIKVYESSGLVTMYLSDYTAHSNFYEYRCGGEETNSNGRDGDEYGYVQYQPKAAKEWPGPYGKLVIQITIFDNHADFVREQVKVRQWVLLKNLQVKFRKIGGYLEGYLRGDRQREYSTLQVEIIKGLEESDGNYSRWKEAVSRKFVWWNKFDQKKRIDNDAKNSVEQRKRKSGEPTKTNSKLRRKEKRAAIEGKVAAAESKVAEKLDLNINVRCNHADKEPMTLAEIQKTYTMKSSVGPSQNLPFINGKYKAHVRVVDFFPNNLKDFAIGRRKSDYDILSDYSGGEDTDLEADMKNFRAGEGFLERKWEWRFALQVEDATSKLSTFPPTSNHRMWLIVDNEAAQGLFNIDEEATNLRTDSYVLNQIREKLYILWGDLEEHKNAQASILQQQIYSDQGVPPSSNNTTLPSSPVRRPGEEPDPDSDKENEIQQSKTKTKRKKEDAKAQEPPAPLTSVVKNKAFTCCIKQYGIKVPEEDSSKATAGNGYRWERKFGLFGTTII